MMQYSSSFVFLRKGIWIVYSCICSLKDLSAELYKCQQNNAWVVFSFFFNYCLKYGINIHQTSSNGREGMEKSVSLVYISLWSQTPCVLMDVAHGRLFEVGASAVMFL